MYDVEMRKKGKKDASKPAVAEHVTYDCAFLEPLAFPPDLPPVILKDLGWD